MDSMMLLKWMRQGKFGYIVNCVKNLRGYHQPVKLCTVVVAQESKKIKMLKFPQIMTLDNNNNNNNNSNNNNNKGNYFE